MTAFLVTEWFGAFRLENGRVAAQSLFPRDPKALAEKLKAMQDGGVLPEERELVGNGPVLVCEERLLTLPGARRAHDEKVPAAPRPQDYNYPMSLLHDAALALGRENVREASAGRDKHVVMAVETIDDILEASNLLTERLREWYALHAPEIVDKVQRPEELAALVSAHGTRDAILKARPELAVPDSMGADLTEEDQVSIRAFARSVSHLYGAKADVEKYLDEAMPQVAPNLTALLGAILAARFIRTAGGLERLARMPAGTIQTLGAEKALFRHIKEGKKPPKHGLLFQHLSLHRAHRHQRGALARALAAKVAIAARADAFTKADLREQLVGQWEQREANLRRSRTAPSRGRERFTPPAGRRGFEPGAERPRGPPAGRGPSRGPPGGKPGFREERGPRPAYADRAPRSDRPPYGGPPRGDRPPYGDRPPRGERPGYGGPPRGDRPSYGGPPRGDRPPYGGPPRGDRPQYGDRPPRGDRPPYGGDRPPYGGDRGPRSGGPGGSRPPFGKKDKRRDRE